MVFGTEYRFLIPINGFLYSIIPLNFSQLCLYYTYLEFKHNQNNILFIYCRVPRMAYGDCCEVRATLGL